MIQERTINRLVIGFFEDLRGIPQRFEDVSNYVRLRINRPAESLSQRSLSYLESAGYIEKSQATAADDPMWKITSKGIAQALRMVDVKDLDKMIWEG